MSTFVLVHGSWHASWCWEKIAPVLRAAGHRVVTPDLPGHGADATPHAEITLEGYAEHVCAASERAGERATWVGHSMGGIAITRAAELRPDLVARLVYVAAFLPSPGGSLLEAVGEAPSRVAKAVTPSEDGLTARLDACAAADLFYHDCAPADAARAVERLRPEPALPLATAVATSPERFGRVPRRYVECLYDAVVPLALQRAMTAAQPCERVDALASGHSPFYSSVPELATALLSDSG